ncbi:MULTISPECIES: Lrp/AsnC family transcriptional regulator [unclassified Microbacterium]|uniref:Lrp/AsnC family transcriptional regulator n=1 Tax=unclassified Microbacterium TaxID=2609290 RepID=UPI00300FB119
MTPSVTGRVVDELDRRIIIGLQQDGRASWTALAEFADAPVSTVARRGQQLLNDGIVRVDVLPTLGYDGYVETYLIRINCTPGRQVEVAEKLVESPHVRFVALVTGKFDIFAEVIISGESANYTRVLTGLQSIPGVERWRSDLLLHTHKVSFDWGRQLLPAAERQKQVRVRMPAPNTCDPGHFDDTDRRIIAVLAEDGRASFSSIAAELNVNESSVRRRYERMRANGCLTPGTVVSAAALGMSAETLLLLRIEPSRLTAVAEELAEHDAVRFLAAPLDESALYCELILPGTEALHQYLTHTIGTLEGVKGWSAHQELVFLKRGFVETSWWRDQVGQRGLD